MFKKLEEAMHVSYLQDIFLKTPLFFIFNFFLIFQNLSCQTWGAAYLRVWLIH